MYKKIYKTKDGFDNIVLKSDGKYLTGLWFENSKDLEKKVADCIDSDLEIFEETSKWLDFYFEGKIPSYTPKYRLVDATPFRMKVLEELKKIPYGQTVTYKDIAEKVSEKCQREMKSYQAVGGAVGWNPIGIIIPCHRVVGTKGDLTGYAGGIKNKISLLELERVDMKEFYYKERKKGKCKY